jgi:hypothetical protein
MNQLSLFPKRKKEKSKYFKHFYRKQLREAQERRDEPKEFILPPIGSVSILITPGL